MVGVCDVELSVCVVVHPISSEPSSQSTLPSQSQLFGKQSHPLRHLKFLLPHGEHVEVEDVDDSVYFTVGLVAFVG